MSNKSINNIYNILQEELRKPAPSIEKVLFLTGFIQAARATGYSVPEIENAFLFIRRKLGRGEMEWLKNVSMPHTLHQSSIH